MPFVAAHRYPDKPGIPGKAARMEFEYIPMAQPASLFSLMLPQCVWKCYT